MPHVEGLHTVQWLFSDPAQLSETVKGDNMRFVMKYHDSAKLIPHVPTPPTAGPFLIDTIMNSQYIVLFHQPQVKLDKQEIGYFFPLLASPWYCMELKLPLPKLLKKLNADGVARKASRAMNTIEKAQQKIDQLEALMELDEGMTPDEHAEAEEKLAAEKKKIADTEEKQKKAEEKQKAAEDFMADDAAKKGKPDANESKEAREQREWEQEHEAKAEDQAEKKALADKKAADKEARNAKREADQHDARAKQSYRQAAGASGGGGGDPLGSAADHEAKAKAAREKADAAEAESKAKDEAAKDARKKARESRKGKSVRENRKQRAKEYNEKHGSKNPHKDATGAGNVKFCVPSILGHVPFPDTVYIFASWSSWGVCLAKAVARSLANFVKAYVGFIFDSLAAGQGALAAWALGLAKAVIGGTLVDAAKSYFIDGKVQFKLSTKAGPIKVEATLKQGKDGQWSWSVKGDAGEHVSAELAHEKSTKKEGGKEVTTEKDSWSVTAKGGEGSVKGEGSIKSEEQTVTTKEGDKVTTEKSDNMSYEGKASVGNDDYSGSAGGGYTTEEKSSETKEGGVVTSTEKSSSTGGKGGVETPLGKHEQAGSSGTKEVTTTEGGVTRKSEGTVRSSSSSSEYPGGRSTETTETTDMNNTQHTKTSRTADSIGSDSGKVEFESPVSPEPAPAPVDYASYSPSVP